MEQSHPLGLKLCQKFGIDTKSGGTFMVSHARIEGQGCGIGMNQNEAFLERSEVHDQKFCCGHTVVTEKGKQVELFGWNPDCRGRDFILL